MATQKERPDGWKATSLIRRDFKHSHDGPEELPAKSLKHRKTCRGGKPHDYSVWSVVRYGVQRKVCSRCGKPNYGWFRYVY